MPDNLGYAAFPPLRSKNVFPEIVLGSGPDDRVWVPLAQGVWMAPQMFDCTNGGWTNLIRIRPGGRLACHYHTGPVHGFTLEGSWRYLEHDWVSPAGTYIYEPAGELHTLLADDAAGMTALFVTHGTLVYTDEQGRQIGFEDVFSRIEKCRAYFRDQGRDPSAIDRLIR